MIFTRAAISALVAAGIVAGLGAGGPGPAAEIGARRLIADRAAVAERALAELAPILGTALERAREGAARIAAGDDPPSAPLGVAGRSLADAEPVAARARAAVGALDAVRRAANPEAPALASFMAAGEVAALGFELTALGPSADAFAALRMRAENLPALLDDTLDAIEAGDLARARATLAAARADHERLRAWSIDLDALPVWLDTSGRLLDATERLVDALATGDRAAAEAALAQITALGPEATTADRALRIAMSEGAGTIAGLPPLALAGLERRVVDTHATVESILQSVAR